MKPKVKADIFSDVVCPWCYIGKRRIERAMSELENEFEFDVDYLPFELNPNMPKSGADQKEYLNRKFGGVDKYMQIISHVSQVASEEGLLFDFDKQQRYPNTKDAHRLIRLARITGFQLKLVELLFKAYFEEGIDLTRVENIVQIAEKAGINRKLAEDFLARNEGTEEVNSLISSARRIGVTGVPFYIINNQYGISGAQHSDTFVQVIRESIVQESISSNKL